MTKILFPAKDGYSGTVSAIPSKSSLHRMLICAMLKEYCCPSKSGSVIASNCTERKKFGDDIDATVNCISSLGYSVELNEGYFTVKKTGSDLSSETSVILDVKESGSTLRFLVPVAGAILNSSPLAPKSVTFIGGGRLPQRPIDGLIKPLAENGLKFIKNKNSALPLSVYGRLNPGTFDISGNVSSQYISGLLLALSVFEDNSEIQLTSITHSEGYIDLTIDTLSKFGINVFRLPSSEKNPFEKYIVQSSKPYSLVDSSTPVYAENDWSNGAFFLAAGTLPGSGGITVTGLDLKSKQSDRAIINALKMFGANIEIQNECITVTPPDNGKLKPIEFDFRNCPDIFPITALLCAAAEGQSRLTGISRLSLKESDRLKAVYELLLEICGKNLSIEYDEHMYIINGIGGKFIGGTIDSMNDHRIAMCGGIASLYSCNPTVVLDAKSINKSYPSFWDDLKIIKGTD